MSRERLERGFSLVELMVGVVIAILSSIVIYQVFAVSERDRRTTTGVADAQSNGAIALQMLDRDVKMAGWGIEFSTFAGCNNIYSYLDDGSATGPVNDLLAPVSITEGAGGLDAINIQYYDDPANANYDMAMTKLRGTMLQTSTILDVETTNGCDATDLAIVAQAGNCTLMEISLVDLPALKLYHDPGLGGGTPTYNPPIAYRVANGWPAFTSGATVQCFPKIFRRTYRVQGQSLELVQRDAKLAAQTYQVAPQIVALEAQYGVAPAGSQQVNQWVDATGAWASPLATANIRQIKALRIAMVARSGEYEKPDAAGNCTATTAGMVANWSTWAVFDTATWASDWQCYRYKVFETIMPLRNIIWSNV